MLKDFETVCSFNPGENWYNLRLSYIKDLEKDRSRWIKLFKDIADVKEKVRMQISACNARLERALCWKTITKDAGIWDDGHETRAL